MNGLPYYKRYPRDFIEGTLGMSFEVKGAYAIILDLIYLQGGKLRDDPRYISGVLGVSVRKWNSLRSDLLEMGKLQITGEFLTNYRSDKETESLRSYQEKQAENASRPRKNKGLHLAVVEPKANHTEPEPDIPEPNGSGAVDFEKAIFERGVAFLQEHGRTEQQSRTLVGRWRKSHTAEQVFSAFSEAKKAGVTEPVAYITAVLQPQPSASEQLEQLTKEGRI